MTTAALIIFSLGWVVGLVSRRKPRRAGLGEVVLQHKARAFWLREKE